MTVEAIFVETTRASTKTRGSRCFGVNAEIVHRCLFIDAVVSADVWKSMAAALFP